MTVEFCTPVQPSQTTMSRQSVVRYVIAVALVLPYVYLGILIAVSVHEFVGHGLVAELVGGTFHGVQVDFDGMGRAFAFIAPEAEPWKHKAILGGGVLSTIVTGIATLLLSWRARRRPTLALPLLAIAANLVLEGSSYLFWNAVHPLPPGDIAWLVSGNPLARVACIFIGGIVMLAGIWCATALAMWIAESWLNEGKRFQGRTRFIILAVVGGVPGVAWFTFDWDRLAPGLAAWPNLAGLFVHLVSAASLAPMRWRLERIQSNRYSILISATAGWALMSMAIIVIGLWLRNGLTW